MQPNDDKPNDQTRYRVTQALWRKWSGRQYRTIAEQARRYGFPFDSNGIDVQKFAKWFHDFLSINARRLNTEPRHVEKQSPALEKWRRERARIAEIQRHFLEHSYLPIEPIKQFHNQAADLLRRGIERLELRYGVDAAQLMRDAIDDCDRVADEIFNDAQQRNWKSPDAE